MADAATRAAGKKPGDDVVRLAVKRFQSAWAADKANREAAYDDMEFATGKSQWPAEIRREREGESRPCLTVNHIPKFVRQVTGDIRQMRPAIRVVGVDDAADQDTAKALQAVIRHIENRSDAQEAYFYGVDSAVTAGIGHWRVETEFANDDSDMQEIRISRVVDGIGVVWDADSVHPLRTDAEYCFVPVDYSHEKFKAEFPDASIAGFSDMDQHIRSLGDDYADWSSSDSIRVAEYFVKKYDTVKGRRRLVEVCRYLLTATEILQGPDKIAGKYIPIIPVLGEETMIGKRMFRRGMTRLLHDAQRIINYGVSTQSEVVALQPKAPFVVTAKNVQDHLEIWQSSNRANYPYIPYTPDPANGGALPQRATPPVASSGLDTLIQRATADLREITGVYNASLGGQSNETSGKAIMARQREGDTGTYVYVSNFLRAVKHTGRVLLSMIPTIYDTTRTLRLIGEDGGIDEVTINGEALGRDGLRKVNMLDVGEYDIVVDSGPSFATRREEARDGMAQFLQAFPAAAPLVGDLYAKMQEWPNADKIGERLRELLPPPVKQREDAESGKPPAQQAPPDPMAMQSAQMEMQAREMELAQKAALAEKSAADAKRSQFEAQKAGIELQAMAGQIMPSAPPAPDPRVDALAAQFSELAQIVMQMHQAMQAPQPMNGPEIFEQISPAGMPGEDFASAGA